MCSVFLCVLSLRAQDSTKGTDVGSQFATTKTVLSIFGGPTLPTGDFADPNIGAANVGYTFGAQLVNGRNFGFLLNASYISNPTNIGESIQSKGGSGSVDNWKSFLFLAGLKYGTYNDTKPNFLFAPVFGVLFVSSPNIDYSLTETWPGLVLQEHYSTASVSSSAFAYGAMIELDTKVISLGVRYIASKPTFHFSTQYSENTGVQTTWQSSPQQNISFLQVVLGVVF